MVDMSNPIRTNTELLFGGLEFPNFCMFVYEKRVSEQMVPETRNISEFWVRGRPVNEGTSCPSCLNLPDRGC